MGVTGVWNEDDVIWATVRNLFVQGADDVFVIDDESDDNTCDEARVAGATIQHEASTGVNSESDRTIRLRGLIDEQTALVGGDVWWIVVDGDEFPQGPDGTTIREFVGGLPPWVDIVGSRVLEHFPDATSHYYRRTHPVESIPMARWYNEPFCPRGHWKHQLFRLRNVGDLYPMRGRHTIGTGDGRRAREAGPTLLMHHVPLRDRTRTEAKLRANARAGTRYGENSDVVHNRREHRLQILDAVYNNRHELVRNEFPGERLRGIVLSDWRELVPKSEGALPAL